MNDYELKDAEDLLSVVVDKILFEDEIKEYMFQEFKDKCAAWILTPQRVCCS